MQLEWLQIEIEMQIFEVLARDFIDPGIIPLPVDCNHARAIYFKLRSVLHNWFCFSANVLVPLKR